MNDGLTTTEVRCGTCQRLLFIAEGAGGQSTIRIKCPRCKAMNILRPDRAQRIERRERLTLSAKGLRHDKQDP